MVVDMVVVEVVGVVIVLVVEWHVVVEVKEVKWQLFGFVSKNQQGHMIISEFELT